MMTVSAGDADTGEAEMMIGTRIEDYVDADADGVLHAKFCHLTEGLGGRCTCNPPAEAVAR